ncbi:MAG: hypothetical protein JWM95_3993 [Gemmatimonadetes bacterium]|nr:hypothetical protein [Gemmatimonadota bacterium]
MISLMHECQRQFIFVARKKQSRIQMDRKHNARNVVYVALAPRCQDRCRTTAVV